MSIRRIISVTVSVADPITLFVQNGEQQMLQKLVDIYEGRCYFGYKITKVLWIIKMDAAVIVYPMPNSANVPVTFMAETICYKPGDTLVGFEPVNTLKGVVFGNFKHGCASMAIDPNLPSGGPGSKLITTVLGATYETSTPKIILRVGFYQHPESFTVWEIDEDYEVVDVVMQILTQIAAVRAEIAEMDRESVSFFENLFYPWKKKQTIPFGAKEYDLTSLAEKKKLPKYLCLDARAGMFSGKVYGYENNIFPGDYVIGEGMQSVDAMVALLSDYLKKLNTLSSAVEIFNKEQRNTPSHLTIWRAIDGMKR